MKSWFFSDSRSATYGTLEGTVLGFSPWMLRREKQLNTPLLAVGGFAVFADTDASMGLMLDNGFAFASVQVVDCLGKDTAFVQVAVIRGLDKAGMDVPDLVVDMVEPGVLAVVVVVVVVVVDLEKDLFEVLLGVELSVCCP